jgi:hypothetical protein
MKAVLCRTCLNKRSSGGKSVMPTEEEIYREAAKLRALRTMPNGRRSDGGLTPIGTGLRRKPSTIGRD